MLADATSLSLTTKQPAARPVRQAAEAKRQLQRQIDRILWACIAETGSQLDADQACTWLRHRGCREQAGRLSLLASELKSLERS